LAYRLLNISTCKKIILTDKKSKAHKEGYMNYEKTFSI